MVVVSVCEQLCFVLNGRWHLCAVVFGRGGRFHMGAASCICGQPFAFVGSRFCEWVAVGICGQLVSL